MQMVPCELVPEHGMAILVLVPRLPSMAPFMQLVASTLQTSMVSLEMEISMANVGD